MEPSADRASTAYAGFWIRVWASLIDSLIIACIFLPPAYMIYGPQYFVGVKLIQGWADFLITWVAPAIAVTVFWIYKSATPGKMVAGIKIVDARTGGPPSTGQCIVRYLGYYVSIFGAFLGFLWIAIDARKQGWHDKIARTLVVRAH